MFPTVTVTETDGAQTQALQVVQLTGNIHGFGNPGGNNNNNQTAPAPAMPQQGGNLLGTGPITASNQLMNGLHQARQQRAQQQQQAQTQQQQQATPVPQPTNPPPANVQHGQPSNAIYDGPRTRSGAPDPGPPGGGGGSIALFQRENEWRRILRELGEQRRALLQQLQALINAWHTTPLLALNGLLRQMLACQAAMQRLEIQSARQIVAGDGGPPFDPRRSGSSVLQDNAPRRLVLRLQMTQARMRFLQALQHLQGMQGQLMHGQAQRQNRAQQFAATAQALGGQLQPQPTQAWHNQNQQHNNFLNALAALTHHPPPVQPTQNWQQLMQQHGNFLQAVQALTLNPPPAQPTQNWHNLVQQATNFQNALHALNANPPLPLMQGPIANNNNNAPMAYAIPHHNAQHILHGNHGGGQHMGMYNPALHGAPPNAITHHNFPGHFVTYFPVAWDAHDILTAVTEAAEATYHLAHQQANGNWLHPPVWVTRRGITIRIVVVTSANWHGNLIVITAWPH